MAITLADFNKIWASTSPLTPYSFSEANYKQGWNFVGSTPPARQMWDFLQKNNDEKMQYLANNYLPLGGGIMTGNISFNSQSPTIVGNGRMMITGGTNNVNGSSVQFYPYNYSDSSAAGKFTLRASNKSSWEDTDHKNFDLDGKPDGSLVWGNNRLDYKFVKLTSTFDYDFTNKNGWIGTDTDGNTLRFTLPTGVTEVLSFSLVTSGTWTSIVAWQVNNSYISFSLESHNPSATWSGTATCWCYLLYR